MPIRVRVTASAKRERVEEKNGRIIVAVKEPALDNRANKRVHELVAKHLGVRANKLRMISGHKSPSKKFEIL